MRKQNNSVECKLGYSCTASHQHLHPHTLHCKMETTFHCKHEKWTKPCFESTFLKRAVMKPCQYQLLDVSYKCHSGNSQLDASSQATSDQAKHDLWFRVPLMCKHNHLFILFCRQTRSVLCLSRKEVSIQFPFNSIIVV